MHCSKAWPQAAQTKAVNMAAGSGQQRPPQTPPKSPSGRSADAAAAAKAPAAPGPSPADEAKAAMDKVLQMLEAGAVTGAEGIRAAIEQHRETITNKETTAPGIPVPKSNDNPRETQQQFTRAFNRLQTGRASEEKQINRVANLKTQIEEAQKELDKTRGGKR